MIQKKVCMLGSFAVGKTSLVARYMTGLYSDRYLTTVGVKISRKDMSVGGTDVRLLLWDIQGEDEEQPIKTSYLAGAHACMLVVDGTRPETLLVARRLKTWATANLGDVPFVMLLNKVDLTEAWRITDDDVSGENRPGCRLIQTSALTGEGVEHAFTVIAEKVVEAGA